MKRSTQSSNSTWRNILLLLAFVVIAIIVLDPNNNRSPTAPPVTIAVRPSETKGASANTAIPQATATASLAAFPTLTNIPVTGAPTQPLATNQPMPTETSSIQVTPVAGQLYDVTGTANALRCPDTRCKLIETYKRRNIVVVVGTVIGTTFKGDKSKVWMQIISHDGSKVYVHSSFLTPHES